MPSMSLESFSFLRYLGRLFVKDEPVLRLEYSSPSEDQSPAEIPLIRDTNLKFKMRQNQCSNAPHMIQSHGATVAWTFLYDWLILALLGIVLVILHVMHPFYRFVGKDMMTDLKYPLRDNTVPFWTVQIVAVGFPIALFVIIYFWKRDVCDLHHAVLGVLYSGLVTSVITDAIKNAVGRPRPDFFWRCFPDGKDVYDKFGNVICHGPSKAVDEGHKSFPSGHTSLAFAGLAFLSLYLAGKIQAFSKTGHVAKLCVVFLPLLVASLIGISRVDDYWHHWQDVFSGGLLGFVVAVFCYLQFFPSPHHSTGWIPHTCSRDSHSHTDTNNEDRTQKQEHGRTCDGCIGLSSSCTSSRTLDEMESGGR